jgi:hypothetical protein
MIWGRRVTCVYVKNGLFFEQDNDGSVRILQRENDQPTSHLYWVIDLTREEWCQLASSLCCADGICGMPEFTPTKDRSYEMGPLVRRPSEG